MELEFKPDFDAVADKWTDFWAGKSTRPLISAVLTKEGRETVPLPSSYECTFGDYEAVIDKVSDAIENYDFLGESIPFFRVSFAADHFATFLGSDLEVHPDSATTIWPTHVIKDYKDTEIKFQRDSYWWKRTVEVTEAFRERFDGKILMSPTHLQGGLDCLAALRGVNDLLMDLVTDPEAVKKALSDIDKALSEAKAALSELYSVSEYGSINRHGMYVKGEIDVPQCDFGAMISPEMFREFALPSLKNQCAELDAVEYHLDGKDNIKHLEALCEIENLSVIQWVPGAGDAALQDWTDLYERIGSLGLGLIRGGSKEEIIALWQKSKSKQFFYQPVLKSEDELNQLLADFEGLV
ncbi:MAG: uroporphyrinogen decarboxylase/cobalamine-independent methonine synthase family protein [Planctomycetota bacterium]|jgi:5-methyltetrahydrofolate--homocysteine methyltransferase